jgi:hypothetical protein
MRDNPFKSKAQARKFFAMEARGEIAPGTAERWMDETPHFASLPEYVGENPVGMDEPLLIQMYYSEGPAYWELGRLVELYNFYEANQQLDVWAGMSRNRGKVAFSLYMFDEHVYAGAYDLSMSPADLKRQVMVYLEQMGTEDADRLLGALVSENPVELKKGYIDPDTGAWMPRRRFEEGLVEPHYEDAIVSKTITEDPNVVDDINAALLAGTIGIGTSGLVTEARREQMPSEEEPEPERVRERTEIRERMARRREQRVQRDELSQARIEELSEGHGLSSGGYSYENVRSDWVEQLQRAGITRVLEIEADIWGGEVMGSAREAFSVDVHGLDSPVILFSPTGVYAGDANWPDRLIGTDETYALLQRGILNEYERECWYCEGTGRHEGLRCMPCEEGQLLHEGGDWALYVPMEVFGAGDELPTTVLTRQFGLPRPLPWEPHMDGWFLGGNRWIRYRRMQPDGALIYAVVEWDGVEVATVFTGRVDEVLPWLMQNLAEEIGTPRTVGHGVRIHDPQLAAGVRRISSNDPAGMTYIVDGERDADGFTQWVNDAVVFLNEKQARSDMTHFPYRDMDERIPYRGVNELFRLHGPWSIEERAAIFKHRKADAGFMQRFRLFAAGEADEGQRVQLFFEDASNIRDIVIITWLAEFDVEHSLAIVGFRLVNGDNGIEIMNGQTSVPASGWNKGNSTIRKVMNLLGVRAVFVENGWTEEYYLNVGYDQDHPFVYF